MFKLNANYVKHPIVNALYRGFSGYFAELVQKQDVPNKELQEQLATAFQKQNVEQVVQIINTANFDEVMQLVKGLGYTIDIPNIRNAVQNVRTLLEHCNHDIKAFEAVSVVDTIEIEKHMKTAFAKLNTNPLIANRIRWSTIAKDFKKQLTESDYLMLTTNEDLEIQFIDEQKIIDFLQPKAA